MMLPGNKRKGRVVEKNSENPINSEQIHLVSEIFMFGRFSSTRYRHPHPHSSQGGVLHDYENNIFLFHYKSKK